MAKCGQRERVVRSRSTSEGEGVLAAVDARLRVPPAAHHELPAGHRLVERAELAGRRLFKCCEIGDGGPAHCESTLPPCSFAKL
jgi:hypothetical protein